MVPAIILSLFLAQEPADAGEAIEELVEELIDEADGGVSAPLNDADLGEDLPFDEGPDGTEFPQPPAPSNRPMRIAAGHALVGRFANNTCARPVAESPFERMSARYRGALESDGAAPVLFDTGDLLGISAIGRLAVDEDVNRLADAITALALRARALGHRDLAGPRDQLLALTRALDQRAVRTVLTNLKCDEEAKALCDTVYTAADAPVLIDSPEGRVGFVAAISPTALNDVGRSPGEGITLTSPSDAIAEGTRRARALGADRVVAVYDPSNGEELKDALAIAGAIDPASSPDLIFVSGVSERFSSALTSNGNTLLAATRPGDVMLAELREGHTHAVAAAPVASPSPEVTAFATQLNQSICERYNEPFAGGALTKELDRETAAAFVLDLMRENAQAEVAFINARAISPTAPWPLKDALTPLGLLQVLPFDNTLRVTKVTGAALANVLNAAAARGDFVRGAVKDGGSWKINGRALDTIQSYTLVTTDFVVDKLSAVFGSPSPIFLKVSGGTLREQLTAWLRKPSGGDVLKRPVDPAQRTRWTLTYRLQLDLTNVSVINPDTAIFTDTQLARGQSLAFVGETEFRAIGDHPVYSVESTLRARYGIVRTLGLEDGAEEAIENNVDLLTLRTLGYARRLFGEPRWYLPRLYADLYVETEFTKPDTRAYHHLQLLPQAGVRFELFPTFTVYVGGGMTWEVFARADQLTPPAPPAAATLAAGWQLRPTTLFQLGPRPVQLESNLDIFARDLGGPTQLQARGRVRLLLPLFSILSLTATYDLFLRYVRTQSGTAWVDLLGVSNDVYVGLQVALGHAFQSFVF